RGIFRHLKANQFDAVIFLGDWKYFSTWYINYYLCIRGIPTYFWSHGLLNEKNGFNNFLKKLFLGTFSKGGFLYSNKARDIMLNRGFKKPLYVIYNSLDYRAQKKIISRVKNLSTRLPNGLVNPYIVFSGRLIKERKLDILFEALAKLAETNQIIGLLIIGDGPNRTYLEAYSKKLNLDKQVVFTGSCYDEELIAEYYIGSIGCVFPGP